MKKILIIAILLSGSIAWAQDVVRDSVPAAVADSADAEENVIGAKPAVRHVATRREANVLGAAVCAAVVTPRRYTVVRSTTT